MFSAASASCSCKKITTAGMAFATKNLSENPGARLCRPRPAAACLEFSARYRACRVLRLVFDTAALLFQTRSKDVILPLEDFTRWAESFLWGKHPIAATRVPCILLWFYEWMWPR